jgi:hypothetical protein
MPKGDLEVFGTRGLGENVSKTSYAVLKRISEQDLEIIS